MLHGPRHVGHRRAAGQRLELRRRQREDAVRVARPRPRCRRSAAARGRSASAAARVCASGATPPIEKPVLALDEVGVGAAERAGDRGHLLLVDAAVARGDDQHRALVGPAPEDHALGDLADRHAQASAASCEVRTGTSSQRGACGWPRSASACGNAAKAFRPVSRRGRRCAQRAPGRSLRAWPAAPCRRATPAARPSTPEMKAPASTSASRSMPVSMPRPFEHEHHVLGGDVAGRALGVRAAAEAGDAGVEGVHAEFQAGVDVGQRLAVGVVEMAADLGERVVLQRALERGLRTPRRADADGVGDAACAARRCPSSGAPRARRRRG